MSDTHSKKTTEIELDLDDETLRKLNEIAAIRGTTIDTVVEDALRAMISTISMAGFEESLNAHATVYQELCP